MTSTQNSVTNRIHFELLAPRNGEVKLAGNWNNWQPVSMERGDDGIWRGEIDLTDGDYEYNFQARSESDHSKGQMVTVADPKALQFSAVEDTSNNAILKIRDGKQVVVSYVWQHDDVPLPSNEDLVIYELHLGDFRGGKGDTDEAEGNFQRLIEKLDYLVELGVNAIELIPVNETASDDYWGYSQRSIYAVENTYGSPDDFCRLVDECHGRGIRVIHDAVFNHLNADASLAQIDYTYWFYKENPDGKELDFGPKFNYEFYDESLKVWPAREHVIQAINLWINLFHLDGVRLDSTRAVKHFDLLQWFNDEMHKQNEAKPFFTIAEHLPQDPAITGIHGPIDAAWHDNFYRQIITTITGVGDGNHQPFITSEILRLLDARKDAFDSPYNTIHYLGNHDLERPMYLLGSQGGLYDEAAFQRGKMGATLLMTSPGIPMVWMGDEFGQASQKNNNRQPLDWSLLNNDRNKGLLQHYQHLIHLRRNNSALSGDCFEVIADIMERGVIAFKRWNDQGNVVVVVANLKPEAAGEVELISAGLDNGLWREVIYDYEVNIDQNRLVDTFGGGDVKVYVKA